MSALKYAKFIVNPSGYIFEQAVSKSVEAFSKKAENSQTEELKEMAVQEEIKASVLASQAKVE